MRAGRTIAHSMPESDFNRSTTTTIKVVLYWNTGLHRQCTHSTLPPPPLPSPPLTPSSQESLRNNTRLLQKGKGLHEYSCCQPLVETEQKSLRSARRNSSCEKPRAHAPFTITTRTSELLTSQPFSDVCLSSTRLNVRQTCTWTLDVVCSKASYVSLTLRRPPVINLYSFLSFIVVKRSVLFVSVSYWEKGCFSCTTISPLTGNILRPWKAGPQQQPNELIRKKKWPQLLSNFTLCSPWCLWLSASHPVLRRLGSMCSTPDFNSTVAEAHLIKTRGDGLTNWCQL